MSDELKTPWLSHYRFVLDADGELVVKGYLSGGYYPHIDAIVHRVNCHDKLVEALEDCVAELEASRCSHIKNVIAARSALELAKGGTHD